MKILTSFFLFLLRLYARFISPFLGQNCRYYPSCSNYAYWLLEKQGFFKAFFAICLRILRCNGLFAGGIEYPVIKQNFVKNNLIYTRVIKPIFWLVPYKDKKFYLIKSII